MHDTFIIYAYPGSDCRLGALNFPASVGFFFVIPLTASSAGFSPQHEFMIYLVIMGD